jgi:hypothetical protein
MASYVFYAGHLHAHPSFAVMKATVEALPGAKILDAVEHKMFLADLSAEQVEDLEKKSVYWTINPETKWGFFKQKLPRLELKL